MNITPRIETITPENALKYLEKSITNRSVSDKTVASFVDMMNRGEWKVTDQGIGFDRDGKLIDGQHRLWAVVVSGRDVEMLVVRGLDPEAVSCIDKGRNRKLSDELKILRNEPSSINLTAYVNVCAYLLTGTEPVIKTLDAFDRWHAICSDGVRWAVETFVNKSHGPFRPAHVGGALAFAYKTNPERIAEFGLKLRDAVGLKEGEPAWLLRIYLERRYGTQRRQHVSAHDSRMMVARKVLRAAQLHLEGITDRKHIEDSTRGVEFFQKAYDTRAAKALAKPWRTVTSIDELKAESFASGSDSEGKTK